MIFNVTVVHPAAFAVCLLAGILILILPRKYAFVPLLVAALIIPLQQRLLVAGLDFTFVRILVLLGFARVVIRSEHSGIQPLVQIGEAIRIGGARFNYEQYRIAQAEYDA